MRNSYIGTLLLMMVLSAVQVGSASTFYVSPSGSNTAPYDTLGKAANDIQSAVDLAVNAGDQVLVDDGTYSLSSAVTITHAITVQSINGPGAVIVNGSGVTRCFELDDVSCTLSGLTITNGYSIGDGGGVECASPTPTIMNCIIAGNYAANYGGGIVGGTIKQSIIRSNIAGTRGGGASGNASAAVIYDSLIENNAVDGAGDFGGGVEFCDLYNCTLVGNSAPDTGGASDCDIIYNSIIYSNTAPYSPDVGYSFLESSCIGVEGDGNDEASSYIVADPLFVDFAGGNYRLQSGSPCINTGNNSYVLESTDLAGNPRVSDFIVDMGAYETLGIGPIPISGQWSAGGFVLQWPADASYDCQVYWTDSLNSSFSTLGSPVAYPQNSYTDTTHSAAAAGFYKVELQSP